MALCASEAKLMGDTMRSLRSKSNNTMQSLDMLRNVVLTSLAVFTCEVWAQRASFFFYLLLFPRLSSSLLFLSLRAVDATSKASLLQQQ